MLNSLFQLFGSKMRQRKNILPIIARYRYKLYVEPFGGAGGLLFGKPEDYAEVYNDINGAFVALFRVVKDSKRCALLNDLLDATPMAREFWREARDLASAYLRGERDLFRKLKESAKLGEYDDELVAAYSLFYAQNVGFGGNLLLSYGGGGKGRCSEKIQRAYYKRREALGEFHKRLRSVAIENLDALDCIKKYDDSQTLFYIDPPYIGTTSREYRYEFQEEELVDALKSIRGKFVLSCYDTEVYSTLSGICERFEFNAYSSINKDANNKKHARLEVVYASRISKE